MGQNNVAKREGAENEKRRRRTGERSSRTASKARIGEMLRRDRKLDGVEMQAGDGWEELSGQAQRKGKRERGGRCVRLAGGRQTAPDEGDNAR